MTSAWGRLSFSVVLIVLAAVTLGGVAALRFEGAGVYSLAFLVVPIAAGVGYLYENRDHPPLYLRPRPRPTPPAAPTSPPGTGAVAAAPAGPASPEPWGPIPSDDEPFDDPVELADRIDRGESPPEEPEPPRAP